jgi:hypothetical protein
MRKEGSQPTNVKVTLRKWILNFYARLFQPGDGRDSISHVIPGLVRLDDNSRLSENMEPFYFCSLVIL